MTSQPISFRSVAIATATAAGCFFTVATSEEGEPLTATSFSEDLVVDANPIERTYIVTANAAALNESLESQLRTAVRACAPPEPGSEACRVGVLEMVVSIDGADPIIADDRDEIPRVTDATELVATRTYRVSLQRVEGVTQPLFVRMDVEATIDWDLRTERDVFPAAAGLTITVEESGEGEGEGEAGEGEGEGEGEGD